MSEFLKAGCTLATLADVHIVGCPAAGCWFDVPWPTRRAPLIVLRFTIGDTTHEVQSAQAELVVGSDPTADVTLAHPDLAPRALSLATQGSEVAVELLGTSQRALLRVGDEVELAGIGVALVGLLPGTPPPMFGGYDDAPAAGPAPTSLFELHEPPELPPTHVRTTTPPPEKAPPSPPAKEVGAAAAQAAAGAGAGAERQRRRRKPTPQEAAALLRQVKFPEPDFPSELVAQLKRSPFFALSLGVHVLILFIISFFNTTDTKPVREGPGAISASMMAKEEELGEEVDDLDLEGLPQEAEELPDLSDLDVTPPTPAVEETPSKESSLRADPDLFEEPDQPQIGIMPSLRAASKRVRPRKPKMPKVDARKTFTKGTAGQANQRAAEVVRGALGRGRFGSGVSLDDLDADDILVVTGAFDHIERVLDMLRLKYVKKAPWALSAPKPETFKSYKIVFWNCGEALGRRRMTAVGQRLKAFVRNGGYLFSTDWAVANVLPYAFPGYIKTNGNRAHLPEMVLQIEATRSSRNHPLLEGVFLPGVKGKWWLEQASFDMSIGRSDAVTSLVECPALRDQFNRSPTVAATFHFGRGRVLHAMGHYFQEAGNVAGTISAHRLALNFVLMRLDQDRKASKNGKR